MIDIFNKVSNLVSICIVSEVTLRKRVLSMINMIKLAKVF